MSNCIKIIVTTLGLFGLWMPNQLWAQWSSPSTTTTRSELVLSYSYQWATTSRGYQDLKIICKNITTDKVEFKITYEVHFYNGEVERVASTNVIQLEAGEIFDPKSLADWGGVYVRYFLTPSGGKYGAKEKWYQFGKDSSGTPLYSAIHSVMNMKIVDFLNLSQQQHNEKDKLEKDKLEKVKAEQKKKVENKQQEVVGTISRKNEKENIENSNYWNGKQINTTANSPVPPTNDDNIRQASQFKGGLDDIREGDYFMNDRGEYFRKENNQAHTVDRMTYEKQAADKIYVQQMKQEEEKRQREADFNQKIDHFTTSFYAMSNAKQGMRDASNLNGDFESVDELNAAFAVKMREISAMGDALLQASSQTVQAYTNTLSRPSNGYDYSGITSAIGVIGSAIAASNAESKAREQLRAQRAQYQAEIEQGQLNALVKIREEIGKMFIEGGMPLSSHKVEAPIVYMFAHSNTKTLWNKNQNIELTISNVIPIYRSNDGTYPYTSNVKQVFENAGILNPILIGYFTSKNEADKYRASLLELAPNAKFLVKDIVVDVKAPTIHPNADQQPKVDFWGNKIFNSTTRKDNLTTENDFWGLPVKKEITQPK